MNFGFLGIQFGWGLQLAYMSAIYAKLGAEPSKIPILWLAGPITGLLIQPVIGAMSDRTWCWLGRRRPYFTTGALLSSAALFFMPDAPKLWVAASMLWVLDASINISMEPFRAFVADKLPDQQRTVGFVMQSFFIGIGAAAANALPDILGHFGVNGNAPNGVPYTVQYAFKLGAVVFLLAVVWTVLSSKEYPPENMEEFLRKKREPRGFRVQPAFLLMGAMAGGLLGAARGALVEQHLTPWHLLAGAAIGTAIGTVLSGPHVSSAIREMPVTMKQLGVVQFFTWLGLFCMWMFFGLATAQQIFHTTDPKSTAFDQGIAFGGRTFAWYSVVCFAVAFVLPLIARATSRKLVHALALLAGGVGLLSTGFIHDRGLWQCTMLGVGIAWASILAMPYAMLSGALPAERMGVYMGIFNFFIVIPEILASVALEPIVKKAFGNDPVKVVMLGGASMLIAAAMVVRVKDVGAAQKMVSAETKGSLSPLPIEKPG
ncbi:MAG TPA: MFS transporter [Candidatus Binatia bacterium]|nr:MFS transporter [Candidatus Binatia bacterium]